MLNTNSEYLKPEIMDVIRLFNAEEEDCTHYFSYSGGKFYNCIEYGGNFYDFEDEFNPEDEVEFKRYAKRFSKLAFYNVLSKAKNVSLPWGALTGIRPTKLAYGEIEMGRDFKPLFKQLKVIDPNISLVERVLKGQQKVYNSNKGQGVDLFISLPFCPTKCEYCSFITAPIDKTRRYVDDYINCLVKEIVDLKGYIGRVNSIYIGGGTPFTITDGQFESVLKAIKTLDIPETEYTVEAGRPDTFTEQKLRICKDYGVNRICVNPQSFSDATLQAIGRKHTVADMYAAYALAEKFGFDINVDLIAGLRGETVENFSHSVDCAVQLSPANITVHTLSLKAGAKLKENISRIEGEGIAEMVALSRERLTAAGYEPYYLYRQKYQAGGNENCGWCKNGKTCAYNVDVMEEICSNIAVGANAISKRVFGGGAKVTRMATPKDIPTYLEKCDRLIAERRQFFE